MAANGEARAYRCGLEAALEVIGGKWKVLILWHLHPERRRFGELKRRVRGISEKMLIQQLREMEADGIVRRDAFAEIPPRVEYSATDFGVTLKQALTPLCEWGDEHMDRIGATRQPCGSETQVGSPVGTDHPTGSSTSAHP